MISLKIIAASQICSVMIGVVGTNVIGLSGVQSGSGGMTDRICSQDVLSSRSMRSPARTLLTVGLTDIVWARQVIHGVLLLGHPDG